MDKPSSSYSQARHVEEVQERETEPIRDMRELSAQHSLYETKNRPHQDRGWKYAFLGLLALSAAWGVAAIIKSDKRFDQYSATFFATSTSCNVAHFESLNPVYADQVDHTWVNAYRRSVALWLPISAATGFLFSVSYVLLFRRFARVMVIVSVAISLLLAYLFAILTLSGGAVATGVVLLVVAVLLTGFYWYIRSHLYLVAKLLSVAGTGLLDNPLIIPTAIGVKLGGVGIIGYLAFAFISAIYVGEAGPAAGAVHVYPGVNGENGQCTDAMDLPTNCCEWRVAGWSVLYCCVSMVSMMWTAAAIMQIKLYVCADVIACWYFQPAGYTAEEDQPSVRRALRNCLGPSFGSVAFAAAILAVVRAIRSTLQRCSRSSLVCCIINCFAQPLLALIERFTQFSTIASAITGRSFLDSSRTVFDTLMRCSLPLWTLWWLPEMVLGATATLFSLTWSAIVYFAVYEQWEGKEDWERTTLALAVGGTCLACVAFQAHFVSGLLLDVVNTIYICYAYDRDVRCVTRPDIHVIYQAVPTVVGPIVENPDGALAYGAPQQGQQQQHDYARQSYAQPQGQQPQLLYPAPLPQQQQYAVPMHPPPVFTQPVQYVYPGQPVPGHPVPSYQMATSYGHAQQAPYQQQQQQ